MHNAYMNENLKIIKIKKYVNLRGYGFMSMCLPCIWWFCIYLRLKQDMIEPWVKDETGDQSIDLQIFSEERRSVFNLLLRTNGKELECSGICLRTEELLSSGELQVEILEPCRRTRVSFSGLDAQQTEFIKLSFFFQVLNSPVELEQGWVQFGSAIGTVVLGSDEQEFHLR